LGWKSPSLVFPVICNAKLFVLTPIPDYYNRGKGILTTDWEENSATIHSSRAIGNFFNKCRLDLHYNMRNGKQKWQMCGFCNSFLMVITFSPVHTWCIQKNWHKNCIPLALFGKQKPDKLYISIVCKFQCIYLNTYMSH